jgi:pyruvate decarboxylase
VLNNDGYVIERKIHGENAAYNDIASWRWQEMLQFFGAKEGSTASYRVNNRRELEELFANADFAKAEKLQ